MLARLAATLLTAAVATPAATPVVHRGQLVHLRTTGPVDSRGACAAQVNYVDGFLQQPGVRYLYLGHVTFVFRIPRNAAYGPAQWTVRCGLTMERHGTWRVAPVG
jgi:hypothetical protein